MVEVPASGCSAPGGAPGLDPARRGRGLRPHGLRRPPRWRTSPTACGVTKLIVYRHFDSKEELYRAILQRVFDRQAEELVARPRAPVAVGPRRPHAPHRGPRGPRRLHAAVAPRRPRGRSSPPTPSSCGRCRSRAVRDLMAIASGDAVFDEWSGRGRDRLAGGGGADVARGRRRRARRRHGPAGPTQGLRRMRAGWVDAAIPFSP